MPRRSARNRLLARGSMLLLLASGLALAGVRAQEPESGVPAPPATGPTQAAAPPTYKNLVLVIADALSSRHLPSYGYARDTAPFLTKLAHEGIQFQGYSASPWTRSSMATLLTGLYPQRHSAVDRKDALPSNVPFLAELLTGQGFQTVAYVTNGNVGKNFGFDRGYTQFISHLSTAKPRASWVRTEVGKLLPSLRSPFFLYVHLIDPHDPYVPHRAWDNDPPSPAEYTRPQEILNGKKPASDALIAQIRNQYDGEIREMDSGVESMIADLRGQGLLKETLVVFTADHGEEFYEHKGLVHGRTLYDEVVQVPFILWNLKPPMLPRSSVEPFNQVDFLPTVLEALGLPGQAGGDGNSRWSAIAQGDSLGEQEIVSHLNLDRHRAIALQSGNFKVIRAPSDSGGLLFDLSRDPEERFPLPITSPEGSALALRLRTVNRSLNDRRFQARRVEASEETLQQLKALGYIQ